jgi:hypothetical protein
MDLDLRNPEHVNRFSCVGSLRNRIDRWGAFRLGVLGAAVLVEIVAPIRSIVFGTLRETSATRAKI